MSDEKVQYTAELVEAQQKVDLAHNVNAKYVLTSSKIQPVNRSSSIASRFLSPRPLTLVLFSLV